MSPPPLTAEEVYQKTKDDLAGLNGETERRRMLIGLARLTAQMKIDQLHLFGSNGAAVINSGGSIMISRQ